MEQCLLFKLVKYWHVHQLMWDRSLHKQTNVDPRVFLHRHIWKQLTSVIKSVSSKLLVKSRRFWTLNGLLNHFCFPPIIPTMAGTLLTRNFFVRPISRLAFRVPTPIPYRIYKRNTKNLWINTKKWYNNYYNLKMQLASYPFIAYSNTRAMHNQQCLANRHYFVQWFP